VEKRLSILVRQILGEKELTCSTYDDEEEGEEETV